MKIALHVCMRWSCLIVHSSLIPCWKIAMAIFKQCSVEQAGIREPKDGVVVARNLRKVRTRNHQSHLFFNCRSHYKRSLFVHAYNHNACNTVDCTQAHMHLGIDKVGGGESKGQLRGVGGKIRLLWCQHTERDQRGNRGTRHHEAVIVLRWLRVLACTIQQAHPENVPHCMDMHCNSRSNTSPRPYIQT